MNRRTKMAPLWIAAGGAAAATASSVFAGDPASAPDADARIAALEAQRAGIDARIESMRAGGSAVWLSEPQREEMRALVQEVLADTETRASLQGSGATAGYDKGFFLASADGNFLLKISFHSQFRYVYNHREGEGIDQDTAGFEWRRLKMNTSGNVFSKDLKYKIQGQYDRSTGVFELDEAYFDLLLGDDSGWVVRWGQFKPAFLREELVSSSRQLAVERSYVNELVTAGKSQGLELQYGTDSFNAKFGFTDGLARDDDGTQGERQNTNFTADGSEWAIHGRAEARLAGDWKQFEDFTSWSEDEFGALVGVAAFYQDEEYGTGASEVKLLDLTADVSLEFGQANLFGAVVGRITDPNSDATDELEQFGFVVQGGYHIVPDKWELFGRYEWFDFDDASAITDEYSAVTAGVNYYVPTRKHNWKWTTDVVYNFDGVPDGSSGLGLLTDVAGEDGQYAVRTQMQVAF